MKYFCSLTRQYGKSVLPAAHALVAHSLICTRLRFWRVFYDFCILKAVDMNCDTACHKLITGKFDAIARIYIGEHINSCLFYTSGERIRDRNRALV